jgi:hypothetical protein
MASAASADIDEDEVDAVQEETSISPCMPHLTYSASELDARYPPLVAPPDEGLIDISDDKRDAVYQHGLRIAEDIRAEVAAQGRKRRPDPESNTGDLHANVVCSVTSDADVPLSVNTHKPVARLRSYPVAGRYRGIVQRHDFANWQQHIHGHTTVAYPYRGRIGWT